MDEEYTVYIPQITAASITPNPASMNTGFLLSVSAEDIAVTVGATYFQTDEVYSGEV